VKKKLALLFIPVIIAVILLVSLSGCNSTTAANAIQSQQQGISVSGEGKVEVTPDIATLNLGVTAEAPTVAEAQAQVSTAMDQVMSALTSNGIAQKDIKTQNYTIQQVTSPSPPPVTVIPYNSSSGASSSGSSAVPIAPPITTLLPITTTPSQVISYQVSNTITVTIRTIDNTGSIIDAVVSAGGNLISIDSVSLSVDQPDQYYTQARQLAMTDASNKASQLAKLAGVILGKAISISESSSTPVYPPIFRSAGVAAPSTSISPGEIDITIDVQAVYSIN
jgi:uncharacterized protein YggE